MIAAFLLVTIPNVLKCCGRCNPDVMLMIAIKGSNEMDNTLTDSLVLALAYLKRHPTRFIFPIRAGAKFPPCVRDNLETNCSNDPTQISKWARQFRNCNWGVAHRKSGLMVADVDTNPAKGKQGQVTFDALDLMYGWPDTETVTTPSGGHHHYYVGEHVMALGKNGVGLDIDFPNYTLIPGCTFDDGTSYVLTSDVDAVACPQWIYDTIKNAKASARITSAGEIVVDLDQPANVALAIDFLKTDAEPAIEGSGGDFNTYKTAAYLKDIGISPALALDLMLEHYNPRCEPEWDRDGMERKVASAYTYTNLSKVGGKTAEADFADDPPEMNFKLKGDPNNISTPEKRAAAKAAGAKKPWDTQCAIIVSPPAFVDIKRRKLLNKSSFNNRFGRFGGDESHRKAIRSKLIMRYSGVGFRPIDVKSFRVAGQLIFNMYQPQAIEPMDGEPEVLLAHLEYLIQDPLSREHLLNWLAWIVQNPDRKLMHAVLLLGNKRTGKSWFSELMKVILGAHNVSEPSKHRVASEFNGWLANRRLVVIHELREKGARGLYDELKEVITQPKVSINLKGIEAFEVDNFAAIFTISNHDDAIPIDDQEGRYLVIRCADAPNFGKGTAASADYYTRLFGCIGTSDAPGDEARKVLRYLLARDLDNWDGKGSKYKGQGTAPETEAKDDMVEAAQTSVARWVRDTVEAKRWPLCGPIASAADVLDALPIDIERHLRNLRTVEAAMREIGMRPLSKFKQLRTQTGRKRLWAIDAATLASLCAKRQGYEVAKMYDKLKAAGSAAQARVDDDEARAEMMVDDAPSVAAGAASDAEIDALM
jgi:hypothetical protein